VVEADEKEAGDRALLNFGHTFAHALEALSRGEGLRHGEAVAVGMCAAAKLAESQGGFPPEDTGKLGNLLTRLGLETEWPKTADPDGAFEALLHDKKFVGRTTRLVLPDRIGRAKIVEGLPAEKLRSFLKSLAGS
jgi:3-dehydroquinate synthase